jgi:hypothetical protein
MSVYRNTRYATRTVNAVSNVKVNTILVIPEQSARLVHQSYDGRRIRSVTALQLAGVILAIFSITGDDLNRCEVVMVLELSESH